jgi:ParB family chromosome partitioning protein
MSKDKPRLGRGLASLVGGLSETGLGEIQSHSDTQPNVPSPGSSESQHTSRVVIGPQTHQLALDVILPNPYQPRTEIDLQALDELAGSIREHGIVQPIVVRVHDGGYQLIAGHRRVEAAKRSGLSEIPAIVRQATDQEMLEIALIENIQREDLNCVDRAWAYKHYQEAFGLGSEQLAERLGQDRTTVVNYLRLLSLPDEVLQLLRPNRLTMGHARALAGLDNPSLQIKLAVQIVQQGLSVRQAEALAARSKEGHPAQAKIVQKSPNILDLEQQMTRSLSTRVQIKAGRKKDTGKVIIEYYSLDDFERIMDHVCGQEREEL